jgi:uncharacterized protein YjiS (DUF1127 family)
MPCANKGCSSLISTRMPAPVWVDWPRSNWASALLRWYCWTRERQRQRRALRQLDDALLTDIGVSREQAMREAAKWFWMQ